MAGTLTRELAAAASQTARRCCDFLNAGVSPFHAVARCTAQLRELGYEPLREDRAWSLRPLGKYYVTRNQSSLIAFAVGGAVEVARGCGGFKVIGAHTDSPCLVVKPRSAQSGSGYRQVSVQTYGGGLWHTWFDRDLTLAGRVVVKAPQDGIATRLLHIPRPILRVPTLAIHLTTAEEREAFKFNKETHLAPVLCTEVMAQLQGGGAEGGAEAKKGGAEGERMHADLSRLIAEQLGVVASDILDYELCVADTQPAAVGGVYDEFIFSPRVDNLISCFAAVEALRALRLDGDPQVSVVAFFDDEEVGSDSAAGASGSFIVDVMRRAVSAFASGDDGREAFERAIANSFMMSVDGAHGVHPNYADKHEARHRPLMHRGPALKYNANQRYATTGVSAAVVRRCAELSGVPLQEVVVRNDCPCGSTIGPLLSTRTGIRTMDVGNAMLSMHSIREQCGTVDLLHLLRLLEGFLRHFATVNAALGGPSPDLRLDSPRLDAGAARRRAGL